MKTQPLSVVYLGLNDFPLGLAETQRVRLVGRGLIEQGCLVTVLSRSWSVMRWDGGADMPAQGVYEGIRYVNASGHLLRPDSWFGRKVLRFLAPLREMWIIARLRFRGECAVAILSNHSFLNLLFYRALSLILGFPLVLNLVEYYTAMRQGDKKFRQWSAELFDRYAFTFVDGVLPISDFLAERVQRYAPRKPSLKVPILVDMERYAGLTRKPEETYLLFCGYLGYMEIIRFILDAFERSTRAGSDVFLYLIVNGRPEQWTRFEEEIGRLHRRPQMRIFSSLSDREVSILYLNAYALLIPLRPTPQDEARFPHKIGEYLAAGRPIISTNYGEVRAYFRDCENAVVTPSYSASEYANAIDALLSDPADARRIGETGKSFAAREFNHRIHGRRIKEFLDMLTGRTVSG